MVLEHGVAVLGARVAPHDRPLAGHVRRDLVELLLRPQLQHDAERPRPEQPPHALSRAHADKIKLVRARGLFIVLSRGTNASPRSSAGGDEAAAHHALVLTVHHIIEDGWSLRLLFERVQAEYNCPGAVLPPPDAIPVPSLK